MRSGIQTGTTRQERILLAGNTRAGSKPGNPSACEVFYLPALLHEVKALARLHAESAGVELICKTPGSELKHPYLIGHPQHLKQILLPVIINAIRYNRQHGTVFCALEERALTDREDTLQFTICDTGIGMKENFLRDFFKPCMQAESEPRTPGMAAVKKLLEQMNGTMQIDSKPGVGTTVYLTLPFAVAKETTPAPCCCLHGMRILLAEDDALNREIAALLLREEGALVTEAADGRSAVAAFAQAADYAFDMVLLDIAMPGMNAYTAARAIRSSGKPGAGTVPILAMTASTFEVDRQRSLAAGINAHIPKPLDLQTLTDALQTLPHRGPTADGRAG